RHNNSLLNLKVLLCVVSTQEKRTEAMGGNSRQKSSTNPFALFSFFKLKSSRPRKFEDDSMKAYRVWPSDQDRGRYVADPGIDRRADEYIAGRTESWKTAGNSC
ncbi:unnamed protein product, partial [Ilex paraguariensis]